MTSRHEENLKLHRDGILLPLYDFKELPVGNPPTFTTMKQRNQMMIDLVKAFKLKHPEASLYARAVLEAEYDEDQYQTYEVLGEVLGYHTNGFLIVRDNPVMEEHDWCDYYAPWGGDGKTKHFSLHPELTEKPEDRRDCLWIGYDEYITQIFIDSRTASNLATSTKLDRIER